MQFKNLALVQVKKLAQNLAKEVKKTGMVIGLTGNLGSGKTTFVKAFATKLGFKKIHSPTFVISHQYRLGSKFLYHLDFYRLAHLKQLAPLGLEEIIGGKNIALIEWVDKFPKIFKQCDLVIHFQVKPYDQRDITIKFQN